MQIHLSRDGQKLGVFSLEEVKARLASGEFRATDLAWSEGRTEWSPLSTIPGVAIAPASPPPLGLPPVPPPLQRMPPVLNPPAPPLAVASLVCGILSLTVLPFLASIPAIVCGHMAQSQIKRSGGTMGGSGMATAGLIIGYLGFVVIIPIVALLAGIALPVFAQVQIKAKQTKSLSNAKQIAIGCKMYALDHDGAFPKTVEELYPDIIESREVFICPVTGPSDPMGYIYFGGKETDPADKVLIVSKTPDKRGKRAVVHVDGTGAIEQYTLSLPAPR